MTTRPTTRAHTDGAVKSFPAPSQLATMTDLTQQEAHLAGSHFYDYHRLFDKHADQIFAAIDILAERVRRVGGTTIRSISHIGHLQTIKDDNDDFVPAGEMIQRLMEDNAHLAKTQRAAHKVCERCRDVATTSLLETIIDESERRKWFLFEIMQGADNAG